MFIKKFENDGMAHTLNSDYKGTHSNGWTIDGIIKEDFYEWINKFNARNGDKWVRGNFEVKVTADSEETYNEFIKLFPVDHWDYESI